MGLLTVRFLLVAFATGTGSLGLAGLLSSQAVGPARTGPRGGSLEYQVKAAYLLNFTRYVEWPARVFDGPDAPVRICVLGRDPFGSVLDATVRGRTSHGRQIIIRRIRSAAEAAGCQLVFISRETWRSHRSLPETLQLTGLLTVGESGEFAQEGGVIGFVIQEETVRFVVNTNARDRAGLRISSRMLSLAAAVYGQDHP